MVAYLYLATTPYHAGLNNPNEMVRLYMSAAYVEHGSLDIDPEIRRWGGVDDKAIRRIEGVINSMTPGERAKPELIKASRKRRIATGAGVQVQEVNRLLNQFEQTQKVMKQFSKGGMAKMMRGMKGMLPGMR